MFSNSIYILPMTSLDSSAPYRNCPGKAFYFHLWPGSSKNGSVCLPVCLSACLLHLFHNVPVIIQFSGVIIIHKMMSMWKIKVRNQSSRSQIKTIFSPIWGFLDWNSIVSQCHPSNFKVPFQCKDSSFQMYKFQTLKMRQPWYCFIFISEFPLLVKYFYI